MLLDTCNTAHGVQSKDTLRLIALCASVHKEALTPFLGKITILISKKIKESADAGVREVCADVIGLVARFVPPVSNDQTNSLGIYLKPLFTLLNDQDKGTQSAAGICISEVIHNSLYEHVSGDLPRIVSRILERLAHPNYQAHGALFSALAKLPEVCFTLTNVHENVIS